MANATKINLTDVVENTALNQPTGDVLDTGTAAVTLELDPQGDTHNILLECTNTSVADDMTVAVLAGDNPPAFRAGLGDLSMVVSPGTPKYLVLESARFMQDNGKIQIKATPASTKTQTLTYRAYRLPK